MNELLHRDVISKLNAYRRMARNMAALLPVDAPKLSDFGRASGASLCEGCGLPYADHPDAPAPEGFLALLCDGRKVKL